MNGLRECHCRGKCAAPVIMGRQTACLRGGVPGEDAPPAPTRLRVWREGLGLDVELVAATLLCSAELVERIEAGEVEPALDIATRLHLMTAGAIDVSSWSTLRDAVAPPVSFVGARQGDEWGVSILVGSSPIGWVSIADANALELGLSSAIHLASGKWVTTGSAT